MDRDSSYRNIVRRVFEEIAAMSPSDKELITELICDEKSGHYQLGEVGWEGNERIDNVYLHVDVVDNKIWIQHDGTNLKLALMFEREGVPKEHIVLAFHPPDMRQYTDYAAA